MQNPFRWRSARTAWALFVMIYLAGIGLIISIVTLLYLSLNIISTKTNEIDEQRIALAVEGAIQTSINKMWTLMIDNAVWDDAAREVYQPQLNQQWLYNTWGIGFKTNNLYDGTFILDEKFRVLWGSLRSEPFYEAGLDYFGNGLRSLIQQNLLKRPDDKHIYAGVTQTRDGIAFVAVGLVRPVLGQLPVNNGARRYLVITRHLTPAMLEDMGETFRLRQLDFVAVGEGEGGVPLKSAAGEVLGYLHWQPALPGAEAAKASSRDFTQIVLTAAGLILLFILLSSVGLYRLARGEKAAREGALTDWLSHLPNRRALIEHMNALSIRGESGKTSVVFIDLDGFKDVNDIYGHDVGDRLIVILGDILKQNVPSGGMLARMGGDEFAMLLEGEGAQEKAIAFADGVLDFLTAPLRIGERNIYISASIGIAVGSLAEFSATELFRRADIAMYHSKLSGKGRVTHYDAELNRERERQVTIENDIREGLAREEFDVWYQPVVDAGTHRVIGVEALLRWPRRPGGALPPDTFIGIAETSGLIYALGQFALRRACRDLQSASELLLSVNISPAQFRDPEFEAKVATVLRETRFPAHRLQLEVTETHVLENPERARMAIGNLKALGTTVALDDFGTGYSSIGYLRRFNFDTIKIDKSLAGLVESDEQAAALISGTIRIASALGMTVTAEGVENSRQAALLLEAGCDRLQGYYFSAPLPLQEALELSQKGYS